MNVNQISAIVIELSRVVEWTNSTFADFVELLNDAKMTSLEELGTVHISLQKMFQGFQVFQNTVRTVIQQTPDEFADIRAIKELIAKLQVIDDKCSEIWKDVEKNEIFRVFLPKEPAKQ